MNTPSTSTARPSRSKPIVSGLKDLEIVTPKEAEEICSRVFALEEHWQRRDQSNPFFTLGVASYLDATEQRAESYRKAALRDNPVLVEHFAELYERLAKRLSDWHGEPFEYAPELARPGFHIFLSCPHFDQPGRMHYDLQFEHVDWTPFGDVDFNRQLSLTLSLRLPAAGAGLNLWDINGLEVRQMFPSERRRVLQDKRIPSFHAYRVGHLAIHSGHYLHQIAAMPNMAPDDCRITLQAHALPAGGRWLLYW